MTLEEYFNQTLYFSESAQQLIGIETMAFPHAHYANKKLYADHGSAYWGTSLHRAFITWLRPSGRTLQRLLKDEGKAAISTPITGRAAARARVYRAGKAVGIQVKTTWKNGILYAEKVAPPLTVNVKGRSFAE